MASVARTISSQNGGNSSFGTTAQRPLNPQSTPAQPYLNQDYYDTTVAAWIAWDGLNWRNIISGAAV